MKQILTFIILFITVNASSQTVVHNHSMTIRDSLIVGDLHDPGKTDPVAGYRSYSSVPIDTFYFQNSPTDPVSKIPMKAQNRISNTASGKLTKIGAINATRIFLTGEIDAWGATPTRGNYIEIPAGYFYQTLLLNNTLGSLQVQNTYFDFSNWKGAIGFNQLFYGINIGTGTVDTSSYACMFISGDGVDVETIAIRIYYINGSGSESFGSQVILQNAIAGFFTATNADRQGIRSGSSGPDFKENYIVGGYISAKAAFVPLPGSYSIRDQLWGHINGKLITANNYSVGAQEVGIRPTYSSTSAGVYLGWTTFTPGTIIFINTTNTGETMQLGNESDNKGVVYTIVKTGGVDFSFSKPVYDGGTGRSSFSQITYDPISGSLPVNSCTLTSDGTNWIVIGK